MGQVFRLLMLSLPTFATVDQLTNDGQIAIGAAGAALMLGIVIYDAGGKW